MNRLEMAQKLFENPKLKAKNNLNEIVCVYKYGNSDLMEIEYEKTKEVLNLSISDETWEIIEPERKLKEFDFVDVYHMYHMEDIIANEIISLVTGKNFNRCYDEFTLEEMRGNWTIEGCYED